MGNKSTSHQDKVNTTSHLIETAAHHLAHTKRHAVQLAKSKTKKERDFNHEHLTTHLNGAIEHVGKIMGHVKANYPSEAKELSRLEKTVPRSSDSFKQSLRKARGK